MEHYGLLTASFGLLTAALAGLGFLEWKSSQSRARELEMDRLTVAAAQRQAQEDSDSSSLLEHDVASNPAMAARQPEKAVPNLPLPPPPPTRSAVPPPPPASDDSLSKNLIGTMPGNPAIARASAPPPAPKLDDATPRAPGGWADLLQKVRSNEGEPPNPFNRSPAVETEKLSAPIVPAAGGDAWEALLRKTASASTEKTNPFGSSITGGSGSDPERAEGDDEHGVPDFFKKSSRTISLDLNKGGAGTNPFQKPPP